MILSTTVIIAFIINCSTAESMDAAMHPTNETCTSFKSECRDPGGLGSLDITYGRLAIRRTQNIARLRDYANTGTFPRNTDFPGRLVPYFVDRLGTACAVGHLMQLDGKAHLVETIASDTNHIRIQNTHDGPLLEWIYSSGLTRDECALIQPSYATIEDYRQGREWQDEIARLQKHFAEVEQTLVTQTQRSLREALIAKVDAQLAVDPNDPALTVNALSEALNSNEPNVRIAAAYAMTQLSKSSRSARLTALLPNLSDSDLEVRFWTAVAIQTIGAASPRGSVDLCSRTLPVFLDAARRSESRIRLAALIQLTNTAPMTMGTNRQLRIMPEIRETVVQACNDEDRDIRQFARSVLKSWRWQRVAYESQRIRRQYLAASAELESLATETLAIGREFAEPPNSINSVAKLISIYDSANSMTYMLPIATEKALPIVNSSEEAKQVVDDYFKRTYEQYRNETESPWPFWEIVSAESDNQGLYFIVVAKRTDIKPSPNLIYLLPRPSMVSKASSLPYYWFERKDSPVADVRSGRQRSVFQPSEDADVVLGHLARSDKDAFSTTCDIFAYFLTHHSQLVVDRNVEVSPDMFVWTGRFAMLRVQNPRFFVEGVGSSTLGGGGWDFHRLSFQCDRATGRITCSAEVIEHPISQLPPRTLTPSWVTQEWKLMGWKQLDSLDFFGDTLLPPEYHEAIDIFNPTDASKARNMLYRRHVVERFLPHPSLVLGLLYERAGERESAIRSMQQAAGSNRHDPNTLADVARWELSVGLYSDARKHAKSALEICPDYPVAKNALVRLNEIGQQE